MVKRPTVNYETVEKILLLRLHLALSQSKELNTEIAFLARHLGQPQQLVKICSKRLEMQGYCELVTTPDLVEHPETGNLIDIEKESVNITEAGMSEVEKWSEELYRDVALNFGLPSGEWEFEFLENVDEIYKNSVPASDRTVSLEHNGTLYKDMVATVEKVIQEFKDDHHLDNELGREKPALLKALEGGRELLNDVTINISVATMLLIEPLKRIALKYDGVLVGVAAVEAISIIKIIFGLLK